MDKSYIQDETEILQLPEFILIYPHQHLQTICSFPIIQIKVPLHQYEQFHKKKTLQTYHWISWDEPPHLIICEKPFNPPTSAQRLPHWMTQAFIQGQPNLVNDPIDISSNTSLSLPEQQ